VVGTARPIGPTGVVGTARPIGPTGVYQLVSQRRSIMKSIIQGKKECFICRVNYDVETTTGLHEHHIFKGTARRKQSEKYGYVIDTIQQIHVIAYIIKSN